MSLLESLYKGKREESHDKKKFFIYFFFCPRESTFSGPKFKIGLTVDHGQAIVIEKIYDTLEYHSYCSKNFQNVNRI